MEKKQIFSIRKLKNGAASVAIAALLFGADIDQVSASEIAAADSTAVVESEASEQAASNLAEELMEETTSATAEPLEDPTAVLAEEAAEEPTEEPATADLTAAPDDGAEAPLTAAALAADDASNTESVTETIVAPNAEMPAADADEAPAESQKPAAADSGSEAQSAAPAPRAMMAVETASTDTAAEEIVTPDVVRYDGQNREAVAVNVAQAHFSTSPKVIIVNRDKFPDAISATNISQGEYPVLYTKAGKVDQETLALLKTMPLNEIYVLGGEVSVNDAVVMQLHEATGVNVTRVGGKDRYEANVNAIKLQYDQKDHVVIASGEIYTDALYGVSYANTIDAPVVLAKKDRFTTATLALIKELGVKQATLIGGPLTLTASVETQLQNLGIIVNRIAGANRYSGSAEVAKAAYPNPKTVVVASGEVFSDALVSAPLAQKLDAPILLVKKDRLDSTVEKYLSDNRNTIEDIYIQGGPLTITAPNQTAIEILATHGQEGLAASITVTSDDADAIMLSGSSMQMTASILPQEAQIKKVAWSIEKISLSNNGSAAIAANGLLTANGSGTVIVKATATDGSRAVGIKEITVARPVAVSGFDFRNKQLSFKIPKILQGSQKDKDGLYAGFWIAENLNADEVGLVTRIENRAFMESYRGSAVIPDSVTSIGDYAFKDNYLTDIVIPDSVTSIGAGAFGINRLTSIVIPASVTNIGAGAFGNNRLTSVEIPEGLTSIGSGAFARNQLTSVEIPKSIISIGSRAFEENSLTSIDIPEGVASIGDRAFASNQLTSLIIPNSVVSIGDYAFTNNWLYSLEISDSVATIGASAFSRNELTSVKIPGSVQSIGASAFSNNRLTHVEIMEGVQSIGLGAFSGNPLTSVVLPDSVTSISGFSGNRLSTITIPDSVVKIDDSAFTNNRLSTVKIPESVTSIGSYAFDGNQLTSIVFPEGMTNIGSYAFQNNQLTSITLSEGMTSIGSYAFQNNQLTSIVIPESVTSIGTYAFNGNRLTRITIGDGVVIGETLMGAKNNRFRTAYAAGGAGTYVGTQSGEWTKISG